MKTASALVNIGSGTVGGWYYTICDDGFSYQPTAYSELHADQAPHAVIFAKDERRVVLVCMDEDGQVVQQWERSVDAEGWDDAVALRNHVQQLLDEHFEGHTFPFVLAEALGSIN